VLVECHDTKGQPRRPAVLAQRAHQGNNSHPAMILYKYVPSDRIDVLQSGLIAYPPPSSFNDPFEASPVYPADDPEAVTLAQQLRASGSTLDESQREAIRARIRDLDAAHGARRLMLEQAATIVGVLSLSQTRENLLMWAHYTKQHTGFVIGFDINHPAWTDMQRRQGPPGEPTKIIYSADRPAPATMSAITPEHIWYTKSSEWTYEQEWRFTRLVRTAKKKLTVGDLEIPLFEFPKEAVSEVVLGCHASNWLEFELLELFRNAPYKNCKLLRAELDEHHFKLNIV
jgi:hypothetical protein